MNAQLIQSHRKAIRFLSELYKYETDAEFKTSMDERSKTIIHPGITYKEILLAQVEGYLKTQNENPILYMKVADYAFSKRVHVVFERMGIITFSDITRHTRDDFKKMRNMGKKSISEIDETLRIYNLSFKTTIL